MSNDQLDQIMTMLSYQLQAMNQMCGALDAIRDELVTMNEQSGPDDEPDMFATLNGPKGFQGVIG